MTDDGERAGPTPQLPRRRRQIDTVLLGAVVLLLLVGLLLTYTASYSVGAAYYENGSHFLVRQLVWVVLGLLAMWCSLAIDYRFWQRHSVILLGGMLLALVGILAFGGQQYGGQRWVLGTGSIQPSELAKLIVIIYVADWLAGKRDEIRDVTLGLLPFAMIVGLVCGLIMLQPDFSTAVLVGTVATVMFFTAGADPVQMLFSGTAATGVLVLLVVRAPYRAQRFRAFFDRDAAPAAAVYQIDQALESIKRGGIAGVGLGSGQQKHVLPAPHTDAIFAVLAEEIGVVGCLLVLLLFAVLAWRGLRIAMSTSDPFAALLATGITSWIIAQALLNVAVVTAMVPFTGVPLPFLSFGGSSLITSLAAVGLLLNISRCANTSRTKAHAPLDFGRRNRRSRLSRAHRARSRDR